QVDWLDLEAWNKTADVMSNYVQEGGLIGVEGSLRFDEWSDKNTGELRSKPVILVSRLVHLFAHNYSSHQPFYSTPLNQTNLSDLPCGKPLERRNIYFQITR
ncbi:MAG: single-stranded DNA-binding protein, partial [Dolichospermum sp.]